MQVIYSIGVNFASHGQGTTAYYTVKGLHNVKALKRLICMAHLKTDIPEDLIRDVFPGGRLTEKAIIAIARSLGSANGYSFKDSIYDQLSLRHLERCDIFHGWVLQGVKSLKVARDKGARLSILEVPSSHILYQKKILEEEHTLHGVSKKIIDDSEIYRNFKGYDNADHVLVPSQFACETFRDNNFDMNKIVTLSYGYDEKIFKPLNIKKDKVRIIYCGGISLRKGVGYLLKAWEKLDRSDAELVLVGPVFPSMRKTLKRYMDKYDNIISRGFVPYKDIAAEYNAAGIFAFPSLTDGFGLVVLEAMGCGLPVILTENTGAKECIEDGVHGFIVPVKDADAMAERIAQLCDDAQKREEMGAAALERAKEFTWDRYTGRLIELYQRLLKKGSDG